MTRLVDTLLIGGSLIVFVVVGAIHDWWQDRRDARRAERADWAPWADLARRDHGRRA